MSLIASLDMAKATHTGMVRSHNEDSIATDAEIGLAVLAHAPHIALMPPSSFTSAPVMNRLSSLAR